ncbi:hypothetical protein ILUMI_07257 [Ignelater luminosus]|uniref:Uncharacterized protein n=1 Tax=Ignelater luminosus TaxID=2038154 RepID=A0A8K0GGH5_IGNLU|nr:hypothetical protein ILUMI_07257 [Ignelater luminosus]
MISQKYFVLVISSLLVVQSWSASLLTKSKRSLPENEESNSPTEVCQRSTPCGWAVYTRYTRVIDYFMKNKCECPADKKCIRTDDDISVAAYVYRCRDDSQKNTDNNS